MSNGTLYLHGLPGSAAELTAALGGPSLPAGVMVLDRLCGEGLTHHEALLASFDTAAAGRPCTLIAFSLGAMSALQLAAARPALVEKVLLVSPAAPLELGDFLPHMAGRVVFRAARFGRWPLDMLSAAQTAAMRIAPRAMIDGMFSASPPCERALASREDFRAALLESLRFCLVARRPFYRRELQAYVVPWSSCLANVICNVAIWHGDADDWAPMAMAEALMARLGGRVALTVCPGLGHFSTLHQALPVMLGKSAG